MSTKRAKEPATRDAQLQIRMLPAEVTAFKKAAAALGMSLSSWVRLVCRSACGLNSPKK